MRIGARNPPEHRITKIAKGATAAPLRIGVAGSILASAIADEAAAGRSLPPVRTPWKGYRW